MNNELSMQKKLLAAALLISFITNPAFSNPFN